MERCLHQLKGNSRLEDVAEEIEQQLETNKNILQSKQADERLEELQEMARNKMNALPSISKQSLQVRVQNDVRFMEAWFNLRQDIRSLGWAKEHKLDQVQLLRNRIVTLKTDVRHMKQAIQKYIFERWQRVWRLQ